ncbi:MAG: 2 protein [Patescibacteria group bacterium]|jgi:4-amino-4-deoxy-L-arabinose transferase-like glycosyltransferase|nr:2 protein [Patescibacteria group bacterium]
MRILQERTNILLILFIIIGVFFTRFFLLDRIGISIGGDELEYIINAKFFLYTGTDITDSISIFSPFIFIYPKGILPQAELGYLFQYIMLYFVDATLFNVRVGYALVSSATVGLMYFLGKNLFHKNVGVIAALITLINPWMVTIGRTSYEMTLAMFFYMLLFYLLLILKGWRMLFTIPIIFLAFYSYIGTKIIVLPYIALILGYIYFVGKRRNENKQFVIIILSSCILVGFFAFSQFFLQSGSRVTEILTPFSQSVTNEVNSARQSTISSPFDSLLINKFTIYARILLDKIVNIFSLSFLFYNGDSFFGLYKSGLFYIIDSVFLIIGIGFLFIKKRKLAVFLFFLLAIAIIPEIIHVNKGVFSPHITLLIPFFILIISVGIHAVYKQRLIYKFLIIFVYFISFTYFYQLYFFTAPLTNVYDTESRVLSKYIKLSTNEGNLIKVFSPRPHDLFRKYIFYANYLQKSSMQTIRDSISKEVYSIEKVSFLECHDIVKYLKSNDTLIQSSLCAYDMDKYPDNIIAQMKDSGKTYSIFNEKICIDKSENRYYFSLTFSDLNIENMNKNEFCKSHVLITQEK